jgi:DNA-binding MarR family transcriptional regulator
VDHALQSTSKWMEVRLGITGPQRLVIRMIGCFPGISAGALANLLHVHPSTLTGVLRRLSDRGAIRRSTDPYDSRRALFWLTARGRRVDRLRSGTV